MKASRELYKLRIAKHGKEDEITIIAGKNYADILQKSNRQEEARELLMKLLATSKQVFGSDHNITKSVESML
jgi:threonyl-tRNA synthetase